MRLLLDTHTFLWFCEGSSELSLTARDLIADKNNEIFVSLASLWEISIKNALGKLTIAGGDYALIMDDITGNDFEILNINFAHTVAQNKLPFHHRDPFDRILVAQAIVENMDVIGCDAIMDSYFSGSLVKRIW
jgi:PIN domain nuclease of toxin-antitoxin system